MLGSILLFGCLVAGAISAGIVLLAVGPVRVKRHVARVPRGPLVPEPLFVRPMLAQLSTRAQFSAPQFSAPQLSAPEFSAPAMFEQPAPVAAAIEPVAPLKLRRPRTEQLAVRRERMARGTPSPAPRVRDADVERTDQVPFFEADEMTIPDGRRQSN